MYCHYVVHRSARAFMSFPKGIDRHEVVSHEKSRTKLLLSSSNIKLLLNGGMNHHQILVTRKLSLTLSSFTNLYVFYLECEDKFISKQMHITSEIISNCGFLQLFRNLKKCLNPPSPYNNR